MLLLISSPRNPTAWCDESSTAIVVHELYYGAYKSSRVEHNLESLRLLLADFAVLDLDQNDAVVGGAIRALSPWAAHQWAPTMY